MQDISRRGFLKVARNGIAAADSLPSPLRPWSPRRAPRPIPRRPRDTSVRPVSSNENLVIHVPTPAPARSTSWWAPAKSFVTIARSSLDSFATSAESPQPTAFLTLPSIS